MLKQIKTITVLGDGGWGTTLAVHLAKNGHDVTLWGPFPDYVKTMDKNRYNARFLPGIRIPAKIKLIPDLKKAINDSDLIIFAIPSKFASSVIKKMQKTKIDFANRWILSVTKGLDHSRLERITVLIEEELGALHVSVLSGPTIAMEVAKGIPSTAVVASRSKAMAAAIQEAVNTDTFRIYTNNDVTGVELGGTLKNVIAIACGVCDGLGYGANTKSAILARGVAEMARLGKRLGAKPSTFSGLSGLGDLATTSFSPSSRNRTVGEKLGKGKTIKQITSGMKMVAEGVETVKSVMDLSKKHGVAMPICEQVYQIIYKNKKPQQAVEDLMGRETTSE